MVMSHGMAQVSQPLTPAERFGSTTGASESCSSASSDWLKSFPFSVTYEQEFSVSAKSAKICPP